MTKITHISVASSLRLSTVLGAILGLLLGVIYSVGGLVFDIFISLGWIVSAESPGLSYGTILAFGALIGMPAIFAVFGLVIGLIGVLLFNMLARWKGGIELSFKE